MVTSMDDRLDLVVVGLGYVGLPLVIEASRAGLRVAGLDVDQARVDALNAGRSHVDDVSDDDVAAAVGHGMRATTDASTPGRAATVGEVP
jgi:UDP-N-acetyl-D-mannosaminuronate dehydrogenase